MMLFSGHKREATLLRYLQWGKADQAMLDSARRAANALYVKHHPGGDTRE